jgi:hypothetical protein
VPRALERIMLLDVILKEPDLVWLATSEEKMTHVSAFTAITKDSLPQMTTPQGSYEPVRYFPDQVPIGIHPDGRWILVCLLRRMPSASCGPSSSGTSCSSLLCQRGRSASSSPLT